jgi:hypothetical protein
MKPYGGVDVYIHVFLTSALVGGEWLASRPGRFTPGERAPGIHWLGGWVDPQSLLDDVERRKILPLPGQELRPRSQSLYRLLTKGKHLVSIITRLCISRLVNQGLISRTSRNLSLLCSVQTGSGAHPTSCAVGTGGKQLGCEPVLTSI